MPLPAAAHGGAGSPEALTVDDELALLRAFHRIDTIVTRNSGGDATAAKLTAARTLGTQVVMVRRPVPPPGPSRPRPRRSCAGSTASRPALTGPANPLAQGVVEPRPGPVHMTRRRRHLHRVTRGRSGPGRY